MKKQIEVNDKIILRAASPDVYQEKYEAVVRSRDYLLPWLPWVYYYDSHGAEGMKEYQEGKAKEFENDENYAFDIFYDGEFAGCIEIMHISDTNRNCELGYWLGKPFWSRGIMTEAVREMIRHGFEELGVRTIWCEYYEGNIGSRRVQEKCGFHYQKTIREADVPLLHEKRTVYVNSLNRAEYQERKDELSC